jgi:hypothetical protein
MIRIKVPFLLEDYSNLDLVDDLPQKIKDWLRKVEVVNAELYKVKTAQQHHDYIEANKRLWADEDLKEWLLKLSKDKCWYTEVKHGADYPEIEHFRPKKSAKDENSIVVTDGYYWLAFNLTNYRISKPMPNRKKGTFFPVIDEKRRAKNCKQCHLDERPWFLDPLAPRDHMLLSFNDNGKAVPEIGTTQLQKNRVAFTVSHFGLNHVLLNRRRKEVWKTTRQLFNRYSQLTAIAEKTGSIRAETKAEEALEKIMALIKPSAEFSSIAKTALKKTGAPMAINIAAAA